jgi:archaellum biogenesis ATPase FlaH
MGAGKWREEYTEQLKAAGVERVVIIPDNDEAGEKHAIEIARNCFKAGLSVKIAHLTDLPSGGDVSDWLTAGNTRDDLAEILENISAYTPGEPAEADDQPKGRKSTVVCLADIEAEEVSWLWHPYIPIGKLTLLEGDPGVGKSWITLGIATSLSLGAALPGAKPFGPTKTLLYTVEDGLADTIRPRLDAMGADVTRVHAEPEPLIFDLDGLERIEADIKRLRPSLVIVDPIMAFMGAKVDINKANETRAVLAQLAGIAEKYGTSILTVRHLRKSESTKAMYRGAGSIDFTAAARSVLLVGRDPGNHSSCAVAHIKSNLAAMGPSLGYEIREDCFVWTGESDLTAEQLLAGDVGDEERSAKGEAESFLQDILSEGLVEARAVYRGAKAVGISDRTLKRAKKSLGVNSRRNGFGEKSKWLWELPYARRGPTDTIEGQECLVDNLAPFDESGPLREEPSPKTESESPQGLIPTSVASEVIEEGVL